MSKITDQLYLGSGAEANNMDWLKDNFVTHIVNCTIEHPNYYPNEFNYLKLNLLDSPDQNLYHVFERVYNYIKDAIGNGGTVLVHCHAGISRSSSMVIYFIMKAKKWSYKEALSYVKSKREIVDPNEGFVEQLISVTPEVGKLYYRETQTVIHETPQMLNGPHRLFYTPYADYRISKRDIKKFDEVSLD